MELTHNIKPGLLRHNIVCVADFAGGHLPKGQLTHVSPDEWSHAVVFKIAGAITSGATAEEMKMWERTLLSCPFTFIRVADEEQLLAECNSQRQDLLATASIVAHTPRPQVGQRLW